MSIEFVTTWSHMTFPQPLPLVPRSQIRVGDVVWSSHYGRRTVTRVRAAGIGAGTVTLWFDGRRPGWQLYESYPGDSTIPLESSLPTRVLVSQFLQEV